jgi:ribonuclease P protein component
MTAPSRSLPKDLRIRKRSEFLAMNSKKQVRIQLGCFRVVVRRNSFGINRLGMTATKKVGSSVIRNRFKRVAREFFRLHQTGWPQGFDILFIALRESDPFAVNLSEEKSARFNDFLNRFAGPELPAASQGQPT